MELICSDPNTTNTKCLATSILLALTGEWISFFKTHSDEVDAISTIFQWGAWGTAMVVGFITFIKFLQDNGWIKKRKPKFKEDNEDK